MRKQVKKWGLEYVAAEQKVKCIVQTAEREGEQ